MTIIAEDTEFEIVKEQVQIEILNQLKLITLLLQEGFDSNLTLDDVEDEL